MKTLINLSAVYNTTIEFNEQTKRHFVKIQTSQGTFYVIENSGSYLIASSKHNDYVKLKDSFTLVSQLIEVFQEYEKPTTPRAPQRAAKELFEGLYA